MAKFKITVKRESLLQLEVTASNKIEACLLAQTKARNRGGWIDDYTIYKIDV